MFSQLFHKTTFGHNDGLVHNYYKMKMRLSSLALVGAMTLLPENCQAFVVVSGTADTFAASVKRQQALPLSLSALLLDDNDDDDNAGDNRNNKPTNSNDLTPSSNLSRDGAVTADAWDKINAWKVQLAARPLTSRRRLLFSREHDFLQELQHGNDAVDDLKDLWTTQTTAAKPLKMAHDMITLGDWQRAETVLTLLIDETVDAWPAMHQLATLYFLQGRFEECRALHQLVLQHKPWYFDAIEGMVQVCETLGEALNALHWQDQKLPPLHETAQRREWVQRMVARSRDLQSTAERNLQTYFGTGSYNNVAEGYALVEEGEDSWQ